MTKYRKGFTLIELLVVMVIIGILATLGIGNFATARSKARDAKRKNDLETVAKSLEAYANDHRSYPNSSSGKIICISPATTCDWGDPFSDGNSLYTAKLPKDTADPNYYYRYDAGGSGTSYTLYARLENENDPAVDSTISTDCGDKNCNYKVTSSNIN